MKLPSIVTMSLMGVVSDVTGKKSDSNSASKKKVQTPDKRMKQLNSFSTEWLKQHILTPASGKWLISMLSSSCFSREETQRNK